VILSADFKHMASLEKWKEVLTGLIHRSFELTITKSEKLLPKWKEEHAALWETCRVWIDTSIKEGWWNSLFPQAPTFDCLQMASVWFKFLGAKIRDVCFVIDLFVVFNIHHVLFRVMSNLLVLQSHQLFLKHGSFQMALLPLVVTRKHWQKQNQLPRCKYLQWSLTRNASFVCVQICMLLCFYLLFCFSLLIFSCQNSCQFPWS
jgi:hypothetical protein